MAGAVGTLVRGAGELGVPVIVTEQYPKGLGATVEEVAESLPDGALRLEKVRFSASDAEGFDLGGREQVIVCGIEAHVCVAQTVLDLLEDGTRRPPRGGRGRVAIRRGRGPRRCAGPSAPARP